MMNKLLEQLKKFNTEEQAFSQEFIDSISYEICKDAYLIKVYDYPILTLMKDDGFETNYFSLIAYLTEMQNNAMNGGISEKMSRYCKDWLLFKKNYNIKKAWFYLNLKENKDLNEITDMLIRLLGVANYHAVMDCLYTDSTEYNDQAANIMVYLGNTRAIRDLSMRYLDPVLGTQWQFHLWHMTPTTITDNYGYIFYLGNELSSLSYCPFDYRAKQYYYSNFYTQLYENLNRDIPANSHVTEEMKQQIWEEIKHEVLDI